MVAGHFVPESDLVDLLARGRGFDRERAEALAREVQGRRDGPPRREAILELRSRQDFPILPNPDASDVYRGLPLPDAAPEPTEP